MASSYAVRKLHQLEVLFLHNYMGFHANQLVLKLIANVLAQFSSSVGEYIEQYWRRFYQGKLILG